MTTRATRIRYTGVALAVVSLTAGCGLKQAQLDSLKAGGGGVVNGGGLGDGGLGDNLNPTSEPSSNSGPSTGPSTGPGGGGGGGGGGGTGPGGGGPSTGPGTGPGGGGGSTARVACSPPSGGNTTGITASSISVGIHAPQTGTGAPLPPSFEAGSGVYWNKHKICGRTITVDFQDDKYTPTDARHVCELMSRRDFIVVGAAGTDQIQSCATDPVLVNNHVPYLSAGVTTNGLTNLPHYFAFSLSYEQQGGLVLRNAENQGFARPPASKAGGKWAIVTGLSANFDGATKGIQDALKSKGIPFDTYRVNQTTDNGMQQRAASTGATLASKGYGTVFVTTSPGYFVYMTGAASKQAYNPEYTGPGITMTEVTVAQLVCSGTAGLVKANFLAPYPGIDRATADFKAATNGKYDDIYWSLWGSSQLLEQMLNIANTNLTRENFLSALSTAHLAGGVFAPVRFGPSHFGGTGAYSQVLNCNKTEPNQNQPGAWDTVGGRLDR